MFFYIMFKKEKERSLLYDAHNNNNKYSLFFMAAITSFLLCFTFFLGLFLVCSKRKFYGCLECQESRTIIARTSECISTSKNIEFSFKLDFQCITIEEVIKYHKDIFLKVGLLPFL